MHLRRFLTILVALSAACALPLTAAAAALQIWGSTTCQKRFLEPGAADLEQATGIKIKVVGVGTGKGIMGLLSGKAAAAAASSPLESAVKSGRKAASKAGSELDVPDNLIFHEIARDVIVPIVHQDNPVSSLTWEQLKDIHTGVITNWKEVGGPDLPIRVISSHAGSATRAVFQKQVMRKEPYVAGIVEVSSTRKEIGEVSKYKGAIGAVSEGFYRANPGKTKTVATDEISRPLALITVGPASPEVAAVVEYFKTGEGRKLFE